MGLKEDLVVLLSQYGPQQVHFAHGRLASGTDLVTLLVEQLSVYLGVEVTDEALLLASLAELQREGVIEVLSVRGAHLPVLVRLVESEIGEPCEQPLELPGPDDRRSYEDTPEGRALRAWRLVWAQEANGWFEKPMRPFLEAALGISRSKAEKVMIKLRAIGAIRRRSAADSPCPLYEITRPPDDDEEALSLLR